ncbi:MAG: hypothetical protein AB7I18_10080 [Candidatus Berkiella sp.]
MLLKAVNELGKVLLAIGASTFAGLVGAIGYLSKDSFECVTKHIDPNVSFDFAKLNTTEIINMFFHHNGTYKLPLEIDPTIDATRCIPPIIVGGVIGAGAGTLWLANHYALKHRQSRVQCRRDNPLLEPLEHDSLSPV